LEFGKTMSFLVALPAFLSAAALGLFVGALLTEALVLVPMWRSLSPPEFFVLHAAHAHRLYAFFAPLTATATSLALVAAITSLVASPSKSLPAVLAAVLALLILATYFFYFRRANARFADASIQTEDLPLELARWAAWHWLRTIFGLAAFALALLALHEVEYHLI
jgi:Domain of unknown function (DUF1772)